MREEVHNWIRSPGYKIKRLREIKIISNISRILKKNINLFENLNKVISTSAKAFVQKPMWLHNTALKISGTYESRTILVSRLRVRVLRFDE